MKYGRFTAKMQSGSAQPANDEAETKGEFRIDLRRDLAEKPSNGALYWRNRQGQYVPVAQMGRTYLEWIISEMERQGHKDSRFYPKLADELTRRQAAGRDGGNTGE